MIIVITETEYNEKTHKYEEYASYGIDVYTDKIVSVPWVSPAELGAVFDHQLGEYVIRDET